MWNFLIDFHPSCNKSPVLWGRHFWFITCAFELALMMDDALSRQSLCRGVFLLSSFPSFLLERLFICECAASSRRSTPRISLIDSSGADQQTKKKRSKVGRLFQFLWSSRSSIQLEAVQLCTCTSKPSTEIDPSSMNDLQSNCFFLSYMKTCCTFRLWWPANRA